MTYKASSSICRAAIHSGAIGEEGGELRISTIKVVY